MAADEELSRDEVIRRLRALEQPVTMFGEARPWLGHSDLNLVFAACMTGMVFEMIPDLS